MQADIAADMIQCGHSFHMMVMPSIGDLDDIADWLLQHGKAIVTRRLTKARGGGGGGEARPLAAPPGLELMDDDGGGGGACATYLSVMTSPCASDGVLLSMEYAMSRKIFVRGLLIAASACAKKVVHFGTRDRCIAMGNEGVSRRNAFGVQGGVAAADADEAQLYSMLVTASCMVLVHFAVLPNCSSSDVVAPRPRLDATDFNDAWELVMFLQFANNEREFDGLITALCCAVYASSSQVDEVDFNNWKEGTGPSSCSGMPALPSQRAVSLFNENRRRVNNLLKVYQAVWSASEDETGWLRELQRNFAVDACSALPNIVEELRLRKSDVPSGIGGEEEASPRLSTYSRVPCFLAVFCPVLLRLDPLVNSFRHEERHARTEIAAEEERAFSVIVGFVQDHLDIACLNFTIEVDCFMASLRRDEARHRGGVLRRCSLEGIAIVVGVEEREARREKLEVPCMQQHEVWLGEFFILRRRWAVTLWAPTPLLAVEDFHRRALVAKEHHRFLFTAQALRLGLERVALGSIAQGDWWSVCDGDWTLPLHRDEDLDDDEDYDDDAVQREEKTSRQWIKRDAADGFTAILLHWASSASSSHSSGGGFGRRATTSAAGGGVWHVPSPPTLTSSSSRFRAVNSNCEGQRHLPAYMRNDRVRTPSRPGSTVLSSGHNNALKPVSLSDRSLSSSSSQTQIYSPSPPPTTPRTYYSHLQQVRAASQSRMDLFAFSRDLDCPDDGALPLGLIVACASSCGGGLPREDWASSPSTAATTTGVSPPPQQQQQEASSSPTTAFCSPISDGRQFSSRLSFYGASLRVV